jgi:hypothetical protein
VEPRRLGMPGDRQPAFFGDRPQQQTKRMAIALNHLLNPSGQPILKIKANRPERRVIKGLHRYLGITSKSHN